jgi:hypothetical protein
VPRIGEVGLRIPEQLPIHVRPVGSASSNRLTITASLPLPYPSFVLAQAEHTFTQCRTLHYFGSSVWITPVGGLPFTEVDDGGRLIVLGEG